MDRTEQLKELFAPVFNECQVILYDLNWKSQGNEHILEVSIMKQDGSMDLDTCADVSEKLSELLDCEDPICEEYTLEVCSPGAEREIKDLSEVEHMQGQYVYVRLKHPFKKMLELIGEILDVTGGIIHLEYRNKAVKRVAEFPMEDIDLIRLAVKI